MHKFFSYIIVVFNEIQNYSNETYNYYIIISFSAVSPIPDLQSEPPFNQFSDLSCQETF